MELLADWLNGAVGDVGELVVDFPYLLNCWDGV